MISQVVVTDAGMLVDNRRGFIHTRRVDLRRDKARCVAETARVEDRADLADYFGVLEVLYVLENFPFTRSDLVSECGKRPLNDRYFRLQQSEQFDVQRISNSAHRVMPSDLLVAPRDFFQALAVEDANLVATIGEDTMFRKTAQ